MSSNLDNDRSVNAGKLYPMDLAPQKITIVKSVPDVKVSHIISGQAKSSASGGQIIAHTGLGGIMRPAAQIISQGVANQPQIVVSGTPIIQSTQIVSQGSQIINTPTQVISQSSHVLTGQIISPPTQIISQGTQSMANPGSQILGQGTQSIQVISQGAQGSVPTSQMMSQGGTVVVSAAPTLRSLTTGVRVLTPIGQNSRPAVLTTVGPSNAQQVSIGGNKVPSLTSPTSPSIISTVATNSVPNNGITTSHVPRGFAAGASLAVPRAAPRAALTPISSTASNIGSGWSVRGVVYSGRCLPSPTHSAAVTQLQQPAHGAGSIITSVGRARPQIAAHTTQQQTPRVTSIHRNYQPTKVIGVRAPTTVRVAGPQSATGPPTIPLHSGTQSIHIATHNNNIQSAVQPLHSASQPIHTVPSTLHTITQPLVGTQAQNLSTLHSSPQQYNSIHGQSVQTLHTAPANLAGHSTYYYEVVPGAQHIQTYTATNQATIQVSQNSGESGLSNTTSMAATLTSLGRPTILRKREIDSSPSKCIDAPRAPSPWGGVPTAGGSQGGGSGGSTTVSAASSPAPSPPLPQDRPTQATVPLQVVAQQQQPVQVEGDLSPRKKPRKQVMSSEVRQCEATSDENVPMAPIHKPLSPVHNPPPPRRAILGTGWSSSYRSTALHFVRPSDIRARPKRPPHLTQIASQKNVLVSADGWKVHHLTAQMDDLVKLESDMIDQWETVLKALEGPNSKLAKDPSLQLHSIIELVKGTVQRSKITTESISEARADILRIFTHRTLVGDILTRQADKRCFRKHRVQS